MNSARALLALLACACAAAAGEELRPYPLELRVDTAQERLDSGFADWREHSAQLSWRPGNREAAVAGFRSTERFGERDREAFAGGWIPLPGVTALLHAEASRSSTHRVLPRSTALVEVAQPLGDGWVASAGGKSSRYGAGDVRSAWVGAERYVGNLRAAYQVQVSRPQGAGWSPTHRFTGSWYRGDLTFVTLLAARGREVENVFPSGLLQADVRAASLAGGLAITAQWGLVAELGWTRQGDFYTRRTARIGTRFLF